MVWRRWAAVFLTAIMLLAPAVAEARAGGSYRLGGGGSFSSMGSRGAQTFNFNGAAPIQRSLTPQTGPASPYGAQPGYGYGGSYGYGYGHPFLSGMFGGFFGSWLGGMLFPHWGMGYGVGGMFGSIFSWLFLLGLVWFLFRLFGRGGSSMGYGGVNYGGPSMMGPGMMGYGGYGAGIGPMSSFPAYGQPRQATIGVAQSDYQEFENILQGVQTAWSNGDLAALRHFTTPEMLSYFSQQLAENESQGVINKVENVELIKGEVREAWDEGNLHYATALMHWRARDYTVRSDGHPSTGEVIVGGDAQHATEASEMWTFARSPGGRWLLSAIQQV